MVACGAKTAIANNRCSSLSLQWLSFLSVSVSMSGGVTSHRFHGLCTDQFSF